MAMGMKELAAAACIGIADERWGERPLLVAVRRPGETAVGEKEVLDFLQNKIAKWWMPDRVVFVDSLPMTATGKFDKKLMRTMFEGRAKL